MTIEKNTAAMDYINFIALQRVAQGYDTLLLDQVNTANFIAGRPLITPKSAGTTKVDIR